MALPALSQHAFPGSPDTAGQRELLAAAKRAHIAKRRPGDDGRRPTARRNSLRRVKDSREELRRTRTRGGSSGTIDTSTTTTASPSAGRSFTVANINHGIIYLRPVVRAGNQRNRPQPDPFVFPPVTPPDSADLESSTLRPASNGWGDSISGSRTPTRQEPSQPLPQAIKPDHEPKHHPSRTPPKPVAHVRSRSFSTVDEHASQSTEPGTFKVVIERPPTRRPKTADTGSLPVLEVPIPHYRLGTPRFSARGTAILRSSTYTRASATEDLQSSIFTPQLGRHSFLSRHHSEAYSPNPIRYRTTMEKPPLQLSRTPSSARVSKVPIGPQLYDALTLNPDDHAIVRFSPSGDIVAATPSRLIAHITSPSFLDYELLSDFFLTFRSFLSGQDLVAYLISRLRWAVNRQDDFGRIVRVRTFVALRHWILNYFVDDFVPYYQLRLYFCQLVNGLYKDLKNRADGGGGDIKIVGELKKCWRRTCAQYWDAPEAVGTDMPGDDLLPGGRLGSRDSIEEPLPALQHIPSRGQQVQMVLKPDTFGANPSDQFATRHTDWAKGPRHTPQNSFTSPHVSSQDYDGPPMPLSPASEQSMQVLSCSIPMRGLGRGDPTNDVPLYPHPVPARLAASPQYSVSINRPSRPAHAHKRSGSFSDALRDHRAPLPIPKNVVQDARLSSISKIPGSLVRGAVYQPGSPYLDVKVSNALHAPRSNLELDSTDVSSSDLSIRAGYAGSPGVKKLLGSVRRALSSKHPSGPHPTIDQFQTAPSTRDSHPPLPTSVASGGVHKRRYARPRQVRIDVLAAKVGESFEEAVQTEIENEKLARTSSANIKGFDFEFDKSNEIPADDHLKASNETRLHSNVTMGSRSIVIMDDTAAPALPVMSGALPGDGSSIQAESTERVFDKEKPVHTEHLEESKEQRAVSDAMPEQVNAGSSDTHRRSSRNSIRQASYVGSEAKRSVSVPQRALRQHSAAFRRHSSLKSSRSFSTSLRKRASYRGGLVRQHTAASLATTISDVRTMSSDADPFFYDRHPALERLPARQLRRRPGGDLRAVDNVHDLEQIQRPHSTGSLSNRTHSVTNSIIQSSFKSTSQFPEPPEASRNTDSGTVDHESKEKKQVSLVDTHSSQPNMRPSFEAEVAKLAALPDDIDDDGGIESALMKLEGRYEKRSPEPSPQMKVQPETYRPTGTPVLISSVQSLTTSEGDYPRNYGHSIKDNDMLHRPLSPPETKGTGMYRLSGENFAQRATIPTSSAAESEDSFSSIPLLERGLSDVTMAQRARMNREQMRASATPAPLSPLSSHKRLQEQPIRQAISPDSSIEYVVETDSMKRIPKGGTVPNPAAPRESFLLDEDQNLSDMSDGDSAMMARSDDTSHGVRSFFDDEPATVDSEKDVLQHPMRHPPTPPLTGNRLKNSAPTVDTTVFDKGLPTPGITPTTTRLASQPFSQTNQQAQANQPAEPALELKELKKDRPTQPPSHMPFILAYDSETLAQQFTIIEKDALDEIDWKELIELRWKQSSPRIRDWVEYLRTQEPRGVDVVIARFNLVVKWAVSECVLTEKIEERARCIIKYIHIASHARRLRNYATMYQITIALLSTDCSRLKNTWALVPAAERQTMKELEALVQPLRNFYNLRVEMETATVEEGCIPFIGIYTRDLIYNAQKPAFIDKDHLVDGEHLINFERHHTAAMIVKSLLRLLEASSKYNLKPEPAILSKCLWMAALSDDEITNLSRKLE